VGQVGARGECEDGGEFGEGGGCVGAGGEGGIIYADVFDDCEEAGSLIFTVCLEFPQFTLGGYSKSLWWALKLREVIIPRAQRRS
jgi:hypothetical protein